MRSVILALVALLAPVALAGVVDCAALTATQRRQAEAIGACGGAAKSLCIPASESGLALLFAHWAEQAGYQSTVPCEAQRRVDEFDIVIAAGPGDSTCTAAAAGVTVDNPQPAEEAAVRWWRGQQNREIRDRRAEKAAEAERERVRAAAAAALPEEGGVEP